MTPSSSSDSCSAERELALALLIGIVLILFLPQWPLILIFMVLMVSTTLSLKPQTLILVGKSLVLPFGFVFISCISLLFRWDPVQIISWDFAALPRTIQALSRSLAGSFLLLILPHAMPAARWFEFATALKLDSLLVTLLIYSSRWLHLLNQAVQSLNLGWQLRSGPHRAFGQLEITGWRMARLFRLVEARSNGIEIGLVARGLEPVLPLIRGRPYLWSKRILGRVLLPHTLSAMAAITLNW